MDEPTWEQRQRDFKDLAKKARQEAAKAQREKVREAKKKFLQGEPVDEYLARRFAAAEQRKKSMRDAAKDRRLAEKAKVKTSKGIAAKSEQVPVDEGSDRPRYSIEELRKLLRVIENPS